MRSSGAHEDSRHIPLDQLPAGVAARDRDRPGDGVLQRRVNRPGGALLTSQGLTAQVMARRHAAVGARSAPDHKPPTGRPGSVA